MKTRMCDRARFSVCAFVARLRVCAFFDTRTMAVEHGQMVGCTNGRIRVLGAGWKSVAPFFAGHLLHVEVEEQNTVAFRCMRHSQA